ncbi:MAG TPA: glycosyltransferase family 2 protein [Burkholderiales bacterium]|nr:glycosyltransferase family 2 protein [Burkholderiales bacterium]
MSSAVRQPLVSICIPAFNAAHQLSDSLGSAMRQSYANLDILVFDNASSDGTEGVVRSLADRDSRVRYLRHESNVGMVRNFNACIEQARGQYVKFICADDSLEPICVERMVNVMSAHPQVSLVACARRLVAGNLHAAGIARYSRRFLLTEGTAAIRRCFFLGNLIGEPTAVMFRRADAARGFHDGYRQLVDLEMWFHLLKHGAFAFLPDPLCRILQHAKQATFENLRSGVVLNDKRRLFHAFVADVGGHASFTEKVLWDARMAVTVYRTMNAGHAISLEDIGEVFFRRFFPGLTYPVASNLWRLSGRNF